MSEPERGPAAGSPDEAPPETGSDSRTSPKRRAGGGGSPQKTSDPARKITLVVLGLCVVFFLLYLRADRVMPYTDQARIIGFSVPVVPQVPGYVTEIGVSLHDVVEPGHLLVQLDTTQYGIAVRSARAALDNAIQQLGVQSAGVEAAAAGLAAARAQRTIAQREFDRVQSISQRNPNALSQSDRDRATAALEQAVAQVEASEADLERARAALGAEGADNPAVRSAMAALEQAEFNLAQTTLRAPSDGAIESLMLDVGHFAGAGQPLMTFVTTSRAWIQADLRENNLAHLDPGDPVQLVLDAAPGRIFDGTVRSIGFGVRQGFGTNRGELPQVQEQTGWLRQPQRFPVIIDFAEEVPPRFLRVGAQVDVMVYTGTHALLNPIGRMVMRFFSLMSYVR
jgi:multidrug resistance efflux pump